MFKNVLKWALLIGAVGSIGVSLIDTNMASYFKNEKSSSIKRKEVTLDPFTLPDLNGDELASSSLMKNNKGILIHFWATTCAPCILELPSITKMAREWKDAPVETLFVSVMDTKRQIDRFLRKTNIDITGLHMVRDFENKLMQELGTNKLPESYLFSSDGKLIKKFVGAQEWSRDFVEAHL